VFFLEFSSMNYRELAAAIRRRFSWQRWRNGKRSVHKLRHCPSAVGNTQSLRRRCPLGLMNAAEVVVGNV
jgi:hypothetical protein